MLKALTIMLKDDMMLLFNRGISLEYGGIKMYLFRAINEKEERVLNRDNDITAECIQNKDFMKSASHHVRSGSKELQKDCWISTSKDFEICASEFSIPQMGGYNTAKKEKDIIVIDAMAWRGAVQSYNSNGNATIFVDKDKNVKIDLGDANVFPVPQKGSQLYYMPDGKAVNEEYIKQQVDAFQKAIDADIDTGILDLSFVTDNDRGHKGVINQFSLMEYIKWHMTDNCQAQPVASGSAKHAKEALILNHIPRDYIKYRLKKLETTVLYALDKDHFGKYLDELIKGTLVIGYRGQDIEICVNGRCSLIQLSGWEYHIMTMSLVDLTCLICSMNDHIEQKYEALKEEKRKIVHNILKEIGITVDTARLLDDEVYVRQIDFNSRNIIRENPYDLLAVQDKMTGKIQCYRDAEYKGLVETKVEHDKK